MVENSTHSTPWLSFSTFFWLQCTLTQRSRSVPSSFLLQLISIERHCELNEKSEQVQQATVFKRQTLMFHFSTYRSNSFKHLSHHTPVWPLWSLHRSSKQHGDQVLPHQLHFLDYEQTFYYGKDVDGYLKRWVFRRRLKVSKVGESLMLRDSPFQTIGAMVENSTHSTPWWSLSTFFRLQCTITHLHRMRRADIAGYLSISATLSIS